MVCMVYVYTVWLLVFLDSIVCYSHIDPSVTWTLNIDLLMTLHYLIYVNNFIRANIWQSSIVLLLSKNLLLIALIFVQSEYLVLTELWLCVHKQIKKSKSYVCVVKDSIEVNSQKRNDGLAVLYRINTFLLHVFLWKVYLLQEFWAPMNKRSASITGYY